MVNNNIKINLSRMPFISGSNKYVKKLETYNIHIINNNKYIVVRAKNGAIHEGSACPDFESALQVQYAETVRRLRAIFGRENVPNVSTVHRLEKKFDDTGSTVNIKSPGRPGSGQLMTQIFLQHMQTIIVEVTDSETCMSNCEEIQYQRRGLEVNGISKKHLVSQNDGGTVSNRATKETEMCWQHKFRSRLNNIKA
ncbi:hypothetical protein C0J52_24066 [Blattella germanica]|nr:hypothetical protein C0J52_24066 [Blattella germanica]